MGKTGEQLRPRSLSGVNATFSGGTVDFSDAADWSDPPKFSEINPPPTTVVKLPTADQASPDGRGEAPG